ncbi:MAG: hypothetical protein JWM14_1980 [Chitinophagaceae bacterium]|nr:hypothetical protein [Chitinophagaceae bacterium]
MKNTHFLLALVSAACLTFTGCKKNKEDSPAPATTINDFIEKNEVSSQTFTINTDNSQSSITGDQGTKVTFPKNAFTTSDGTPVTGTVSIELKEIYDKSDMVLSDRPTTSDGKLLISGGEIFISATANGQELQLDTNTNILIELAQTTTVDTTMGLFTGRVDSSGFNWTPVAIDSSTIARSDTNWINSDPGYYYDPSHYVFAISTLGWINCDRFYYSPNTTNIHVTCNGEPNDNSTRVYLIFNDINSVSQLWANSSTFDSGLVPVGEAVTIVAFGIKDNQEYFATKDITVSSELNISLDLAKVSEADITTALESLN